MLHKKGSFASIADKSADGMCTQYPLQVCRRRRHGERGDLRPCSCMECMTWIQCQPRCFPQPGLNAADGAWAVVKVFDWTASVETVRMLTWSDPRQATESSELRTKDSFSFAPWAEQRPCTFTTLLAAQAALPQPRAGDLRGLFPTQCFLLPLLTFSTQRQPAIH